MHLKNLVSLFCWGVLLSCIWGVERVALGGTHMSHSQKTWLRSLRPCVDPEDSQDKGNEVLQANQGKWVLQVWTAQLWRAYSAFLSLISIFPFFLWQAALLNQYYFLFFAGFLVSHFYFPSLWQAALLKQYYILFFSILFCSLLELPEPPGSAQMMAQQQEGVSKWRTPSFIL